MIKQWKVYGTYIEHKREFISAYIENDVVLWAAIVPKVNHSTFRMIEYTAEEACRKFKTTYYCDKLEFII